MGNLHSRDEAEGGGSSKSEFLKSTSDGTLNTTLANYFNFSRAYNDTDLPIDQLKERVRQDLGAGGSSSSSLACARVTVLSAYLDPENENKMQLAATVIDALCQEDPARFAPAFIDLGVVKTLLKFLTTLFKMNMLDRTINSENSIVVTLCALSSLGLYDVKTPNAKDSHLCKIFCHHEFYANVVATLSRANTLHSLVAASKAIIISMTYDKDHTAITLLQRLRGILYNIIHHSRNRNARAICAIVLGHFAARGEKSCRRDLNFFLKNNRAKVALMLRPIHVENLLAAQNKHCLLLVAWIFAYSNLFAPKDEFDRIVQQVTAKLSSFSCTSSQQKELLNLAMQKINPNSGIPLEELPVPSNKSRSFSLSDLSAHDSSPARQQPRLSANRAIDPVRPFLHSSEITKIRPFGEDEIFTATQGAQLCHWRFDGTLLRKFTGHFKAITDFVILGKRLFSVSFDETIREWDISSGNCITTFAAEVLRYRNRLYCLAVTSATGDTTLIATGGSESIISIINTKSKTSQCLIFSGKTVQCGNGLSHPGRITGLEFSSNGELLYSSCACAIIRIWEVKDRRCIKTIVADGFVKSIWLDRSFLFSIEGANLVVRDRSIGTKLNAIKAECATTCIDNLGFVRTFIYSPDDRVISAFRHSNNTLDWESDLPQCVTDVRSLVASDQSIIIGMRSEIKIIEYCPPRNAATQSQGQKRPSADCIAGVLSAVQRTEDVVRIMYDTPPSSPTQPPYSRETCSGIIQSRIAALQETLHRLYGADDSKPVPIVISRRNGVSLLGNIFKAMENVENLRSRSFAIHFGSGNPNAGAGELLVSESMCKDLFEVSARAIVDPVNSLFKSTGVNGTVYIHSTFQVANSPSTTSSSPPFQSSTTTNTDQNFKLVGRFIAKSLLDGTKIQTHFAIPLLKIMLGQVLTFQDLALSHLAHFNMLISMIQAQSTKGASRDAVADMNIDFTTENLDASFLPFGLFNPRVELHEDGEDSFVTSAKVFEFVTELCTWKLMDCVRPELDAFLAGFNEVVPFSHLRTLFDVCDLELALCGEPQVVLDDLQDCAKSGGDVTKEERDRHERWLWKILEEEHSNHLMLRFVHFVFGTTGVVTWSEGFTKPTDPPFTIYVTRQLQANSLPISMPWINTLVLPLYDSVERMRKQLMSVMVRSQRGAG